ncbi:thiamine phosphate synthase [Paenibacillus sp. GP183]|jgi:thiamine-phosphate pyrophosphorylase|uniref:thiamine phosphate synthase n=1 Tax=Paenibacillus sp. GP183 TaxID=1882751 RepID=UPI000896C3BE|nr:thiamine phosphate synthase [Paenibacillus sp. GP183]SEC42697.1 thiamine-phosphate diphosphorylase [Paenibacillus sp. GP183]
MKSKLKERLKLYFVMGSPNCVKDPLIVLHEAIVGGITAFQFREKGKGALTGQDAIYLGSELRKLCKAHDVLFIVNDDVELALKLKADGLHIGQEDDSLLNIRANMLDKIVGVSAHNVAEAEIAVRNGADYLGAGPMYTTLTKLDAREVQGPQMIREIRQNGIVIPIVGIGGITAETAEKVVESGADGVAVVSAISLAASPQKAAEEILQIVNNYHTK